jgi:hypothetical protein
MKRDALSIRTTVHPDDFMNAKMVINLKSKQIEAQVIDYRQKQTGKYVIMIIFGSLRELLTYE